MTICFSCYLCLNVCFCSLFKSVVPCMLMQVVIYTQEEEISSISQEEYQQMMSQSEHPEDTSYYPPENLKSVSEEHESTSSSAMQGYTVGNSENPFRWDTLGNRNAEPKSVDRKHQGKGQTADGVGRKVEEHEEKQVQMLHLGASDSKSGSKVSTTRKHEEQQGQWDKPQHGNSSSSKKSPSKHARKDVRNSERDQDCSVTLSGRNKVVHWHAMQ
jgi:hypothetical protein